MTNNNKNMILLVIGLVVVVLFVIRSGTNSGGVGTTYSILNVDANVCASGRLTVNEPPNPIEYFDSLCEFNMTNESQQFKLGWAAQSQFADEVTITKSKQFGNNSFCIFGAGPKVSHNLFGLELLIIDKNLSNPNVSFTVGSGPYIQGNSTFTCSEMLSSNEREGELQRSSKFAFNDFVFETTNKSLEQGYHQGDLLFCNGESMVAVSKDYTSQYSSLFTSCTAQDTYSCWIQLTDTCQNVLSQKQCSFNTQQSCEDSLVAKSRAQWLPGVPNYVVFVLAILILYTVMSKNKKKKSKK